MDLLKFQIILPFCRKISLFSSPSTSDRKGCGSNFTLDKFNARSVLKACKTWGVSLLSGVWTTWQQCGAKSNEWHVWDNLCLPRDSIKVRDLWYREFYVSKKYVDSKCILLFCRLIKPLQRLAENRGIALFAIDEVHCVSKWGHDFRPDYRYLSLF